MDKAWLIVVALLIGSVAVADEPTNEQRCQEWAAIDDISSEDMAIYMKECLYSLNVPDEDLGEEEEITNADLDSNSHD